MYGKSTTKVRTSLDFKRWQGFLLIISTSHVASLVPMSGMSPLLPVDSFVTTSSYLATCSADTTVKIWSISSNYEFKPERTLVGHQRWVWDCAFSADSAYLVTGDIRVFNDCSKFILVCQHRLTTQHVFGKWHQVRLLDNTMATTKVWFFKASCILNWFPCQLPYASRSMMEPVKN